MRQSQVGDHRGDLGLDGSRVFPLDAGVEQEVLVDGEAAENVTSVKKFNFSRSVQGRSPDSRVQTY